MTPIQAAVKWAAPHLNVKSPRDMDPTLEHDADAYWIQHDLARFKMACEAKDGNQLVGMFADFCTAIKIREATNNNDGPRIDELLTTEHAKGKKYAWCVTEWQTGVSWAERKTGIVSRVFSSPSCLTTADKSPKDMHIEIAALKYGDGWCWRHGTSYEGHWGTFKAWKTVGKEMYLNEGNTTGGTVGGVIVREGGGSYLTDRTTSPIGDMHPYARLRAFPEPIAQEQKVAA